MLLKERNEKWVVRTKAADPEFAVPRLQPIPQKTKQSFKGGTFQRITFSQKNNISDACSTVLIKVDLPNLRNLPKEPAAQDAGPLYL